MMHLHMSLLALHDVVPRKLGCRDLSGECSQTQHGVVVQCAYCAMLLVKKLVSFSALTLFCWFGHLACKNRPRNDL